MPKVRRLTSSINSTEIKRGLADPKLKTRLPNSAATLPMSPVEFGKLVVVETEKWAKVIRAANIKAE